MRTFISFNVWLLVLVQASAAPITAYPALPGRPTSDLYSVTVNGQSVWTEKFRTSFDLEKLPGWFTKESYTGVQQELHIADFGGEGKLDVVLTVQAKVGTAVIHPASLGIKAVVRDNQVSFTMAGPAKVYVTINDLPPLCVFANPPEPENPAVDTPQLRYFGPGVHRPGMMTLKSNDSLYLAAGAIVYGGLRAEPGATNLRVSGRGVLDGGSEFESMVKLEDCHGVMFDGVTIRNGDGWTNTLINCTDVTYQDAKVISFGPGGDGIDPLGCRNVVINRCFFRCTDDCIAIKAPDPTHGVEDILITGCTMVGFACSDGVTIGFETNGPGISRVRARDCDIIMARGGSRVEGGHSAFSIICDGPAVIRDILFEDIRVEAAVQKLFELQVTDGTKYDDNPPGHIQGVVLKNISWAARRPIMLKGHDGDHQVRDVSFQGCTIDGVPLKAAWPDVFQINPYVSGVEFR